jgi:hypothetical protein
VVAGVRETPEGLGSAEGCNTIEALAVLFESRFVAVSVTVICALREAGAV